MISRQQYEVRAAAINWRQVLNVYLGAIGLLITILLALASPALLLIAHDKDPILRLIGIAVLILAAMAVAASQRQ